MAQKLNIVVFMVTSQTYSWRYVTILIAMRKCRPSGKLKLKLRMVKTLATRPNHIEVFL